MTQSTGKDSGQPPGRGRRKGKGRSRSGGSRRRSAGSRAKVPADLGSVSFRIKMARGPRVEVGVQAAAEAAADGALGGDGFFTDLQRLFGRLFEGSWSLHFGSVKLVLQLPGDLDVLEEFWVFLLELVDSGYGEWTLDGDDRPLIIEAQVFGPDVQLEFGAGSGAPQFRGKVLPRRALLRLRAVIDEGTSLLSSIIDDVSRVDAELRERPEVEQLLGDLDQLRAAVATYPATFKSGKSKSRGPSGLLPVIGPCPSPT